MATYKIPVPRSRGCPPSAPVKKDEERHTLDMFLHSTFARFAIGDQTVELETKYDPINKIIELCVADEYLDTITESKIGDALRRYFDWLVDSGRFLRAVSDDEDPSLSAQLSAGQNTIHFDELDNGDSGVELIVDWKKSNKQTMRLTDNCELYFMNPDGATNLLLRVIQSDSFNIIWPNNIMTINGNGIPITQTQDAIDIISMYFDGQYYYVLPANNFRPIN